MKAIFSLSKVHLLLFPCLVPLLYQHTSVLKVNIFNEDLKILIFWWDTEICSENSHRNCVPNHSISMAENLSAIKRFFMT